MHGHQETEAHSSGYPENEDTDFELIQKAQLGNDDAYAQLIEKYRMQIHRFALKIVHDPDEADDIVQDVFVSVWNTIKNFRGASKFSTWLYSITYNRSLRSIENTNRQTNALTQFASENLERISSAWEGMQAHIAEQQWQSAIQDQISKLPQKYRDVLNLRHFQELSYEEMARTLTTSISNVKVQLFRARNMLGEQLRQLETSAKDSGATLEKNLKKFAAAAKASREQMNAIGETVSHEFEQRMLILHGRVEQF